MKIVLFVIALVYLAGAFQRVAGSSLRSDTVGTPIFSSAVHRSKARSLAHNSLIILPNDFLLQGRHCPLDQLQVHGAQVFTLKYALGIHPERHREHADAIFPLDGRIRIQDDGKVEVQLFEKRAGRTGLLTGVDRQHYQLFTRITLDRLLPFGQLGFTGLAPGGPKRNCYN